MTITRAVADHDDLRTRLRPAAPPTARQWMLLAVKGNVDVAGLPTTAACPGFAYTPETDAPAVAALRAAGAVMLRTSAGHARSGAPATIITAHGDWVAALG